MADAASGLPEVALGGARRIHLVGVAGTGMRAYAAVLAAMGHRVTGSDAAASAAIDALAAAGVRVWVGHRPEEVAGAEVVAASSAVPPTDPELMAARAAGAQVVPRAALLAGICRLRRTVAVAGTHGKTTTTAMLASALVAAGADPSYLVGGDLAGGAPGARWGGGPWLAVEADESDGTFLHLGAEVPVVTNLEADHLDHFGGLDALTAAFDRFAAGGAGPLVVGADDAGSAAVGARAAAAGRAVTTTGTSPGADWRAVELRPARGGIGFALEVGGRRVGAATLAVPGAHNVRNALAALAAAGAVGADPAAALAGLDGFAGVGRRFERRGERDGVTYVDDYGHLPGELRATLAAARDGGWDRVVAVFQPHRYSRTEALWGDFANAFADADVVVVTDVYPAGEAPRPGVSGRLVADAVAAAHPGTVRYVAAVADLPSALEGLLRPGDLCVALGAGDVGSVVATLVAGPPVRPAGAAGEGQ